MLCTGTRFIKDNKKYEILSDNNGLFYTCVYKNKEIYILVDFKHEQLQGVEFF